MKEREREGGEAKGSGIHVPRGVPRLRSARHRQCGSRRRLMSLERRPVIAPGTIRERGNDGGGGEDEGGTRGGDIKGALNGFTCNTVSRLSTRAISISQLAPEFERPKNRRSSTLAAAASLQRKLMFMPSRHFSVVAF